MCEGERTRAVAVPWAGALQDFLRCPDHVAIRVELDDTANLSQQGLSRETLQPVLERRAWLAYLDSGVAARAAACSWARAPARIPSIA